MFTFQFLNDKIHNYVKKTYKIYKLSKTNIFFSHFEGTRGEKTKYFAPKAPVDATLFLSTHSRSFDLPGYLWMHMLWQFFYRYITSIVRANFYPKKSNNTFDQTKSYQNAALCNVEYKRLFD